MRFFTLLFFCLYIPLSALAETTNKPLTQVTFIVPEKQGSVFWQFVSEVSYAAADSLNIKLNIAYSSSDRFGLRQAVDKLVKSANKPDYLIFRPYYGNTAEIFNRIEQANIKFVTIEQEFIGDVANKIGKPGEKYQHWLGQVNFDNKSAGELLLSALIKKQQKVTPDEHINITGIGGDFDKVSLDREHALLNFPADNSNITVNQIFPLDWSPDRVKLRFPMINKRYPNTNIFWCASDLMALTIDELLADNRNVSIGGFDWLPEMLEKIHSGEVTASVGGHFLMVAIAITKIADHANGVNTFKHNSSLYPYELITQDNVAEHMQFFAKRQWLQSDFTVFLKSENKTAPPLTVKNLIKQRH